MVSCGSRKTGVGMHSGGPQLRYRNRNLVRGTKPAVCVVVPILNEVRYIREAIEQLLAQDYTPLEIVVYDGGSTDGTLEILSEYPVELFAEPGLGQMAAINRGWGRTRAEFVTWMAGDDRLKPGAIRLLAEELIRHPEAGVAHGDADVIDENGEIIGRRKPGSVALRDLVFWFSLVPQSALIRRETLRRAGPMDEGRRFAADHDLFLRLAQYCRFHYVPTVVSQYRFHPGSEDAQNLERVAEASIDVVDAFFRRPDLTDVQRDLWPRARTGSRCFAGGVYTLAGRRDKAWRMLFEALRGHPLLLLTTRLGRHFLVRLAVPLKIPPFRGLLFIRSRILRTFRSAK